MGGEEPMSKPPLNRELRYLASEHTSTDELDTILLDYANALKKVSESVIMNPYERSKWLTAQDFMRVPLKRQLGAYIKSNYILKTDVEKTIMVDSYQRIMLWLEDQDDNDKLALLAKDIDVELERLFAELSKD